jgi:hypothetical protein
MPTITAFTDHPTHPYVRVEINWADVPWVTHARVLRVNTATGACTPLRPYICYDGDYLLLSCGHGIFWDTEVPLDTPVYYITEALDAPCIPAAAYGSDQFSRVVVASWGSTPGGLAYSHLGTAADFNVDGLYGTHSHPAANTSRISTINVGQTDLTIQVDVATPAVALSVAQLSSVLARFVDTNNYMMARVGFTTASAVTVTLRKRVAGVETTLSSISVPGLIHVPNTFYTVQLTTSGQSVTAKVWPVGTAEPAYPQITGTLLPGELTTGTSVGVRSALDVGSTNVVPFVYSFDNLLVYQPCEPCEPVTGTSATVSIASTGVFWLSDPVRPCNDQPVPLCAPGSPLLVDCGGTGAITFVGMGTELYASNSFNLQPANRRRPIVATRPRSDASTTLRLQTTSFDAREQLLALLIPGSPLMFRGPSEYGIPDRYLAVAPVPVESLVPDLRVQIRSASLPYETVDRFAGPTQGICGARVQDICELFPTWGDLAASGLSWDDLVAGRASPVSSNPDARTWDGVDAEFASWNAVEAGGRTWTGLQEGD